MGVKILIFIICCFVLLTALSINGFNQYEDEDENN